MRRFIFYVLLGACGGSEDTPDALVGCQTVLGGNLSESVSSASCATLAAGAGSTEGDTLLHLVIKPAQLDAPLDITVDLGPTPTPGVYNSGSTALWSAMSERNVAPGGACLYLAGNSATPTGYFHLDLSSIDATTGHGALSLTLFVLARTADDGTQTDCGPGTTEDVELRF
jgi:hypothetical protein